MRFREAVTAMSEEGVSTFVEIGPKPQLQAYVADTVRALGRKAAVVPTIDQSAKAPTETAHLVARALAHGAAPDLEAFFGPDRVCRHDLPAYPYHRQRHQLEPTADRIDFAGTGRAHPLLGWQLRRGEGVWRTEIDAIKLAWLGDHVVDGAPVLPAAGFAEIALAAGAEAFGADRLELRDFDILAPLVLETNPAASTTLRTRLEFETGILWIESKPFLSDQDWVLHARGSVARAPAAAAAAPPRPQLALLPEWPGARLYAMLDAAGLSYGPAFRRVSRLWAGGGWAEAELTAPAEAGDFQVHPATLDGAFHGIFPLIAAEAESAGLKPGESFVPVRFGRVVTLRKGTPARAELNLVRLNDHGAEVALTLRDGEGAALVRVEGLRLQKIRLRARRHDGPSLWHQRALPLPAPAVSLPDAWTSPAARLQALGLAAEDAPDPDAGALIVDAAARRLAWEALMDLAGPDGRLPEPPAVAASALPLYHALSLGLEADGALGEGEGPGRLLDCPYPPLADLTDALVSEAPERSGDLMALMRAATHLGAGLAEGLAETLPAAAVPGAGARAVAAAVAQGLTDLAESSPADTSLEALLIGPMPADLLASLAAEPGLTRLTLSDPVPARVEALKFAAPPHPALRVLPWEEATALRYDAVFSADALGRIGRAALGLVGDLLRPGGALVAVERAPDLMADISEGLGAAWWADTLAPEVPMGALATGTEWAGALERVGFAGPLAAPLAASAVKASVITARAPEAQATPEAAEPRAFAVQGSEALAAALEGAGLPISDAAEADLVILAEDLAATAEHCRTLLANPPPRLWLVVPGGAPGRASPRRAAIWGLG
ncbi:MAG: polyketide synthase dehydratase domain-containing protein, partial [Pseudomonadota bacterium]